ncbi:hypothetical protein WISP_17362 [Willisornis vidua]|uniref:Transmembrane protein 157 n=1 Tax=Willisornis vidua TaxID=1566151 RepID=A0ABQ9DQU1_9PASS|nr:hypothetical protein WISP_17362 [Willisornis vidua]
MITGGQPGWIRRRNRKTRRYGVLDTNIENMELTPLEQDDDDDDTTLFDANHPRRSLRNKLLTTARLSQECWYLKEEDDSFSCLMQKCRRRVIIQPELPEFEKWYSVTNNDENKRARKLLSEIIYE